ncbi:MAG: hypothetical protein Kow0056_02450 [Coriobacteriia bacterium]
MATVGMRDLLAAGVHFGHQTRRWNPKMRPYIFTERNGIYIIDLQRTLKEIRATYEFVRDLAARDGKVLFVGTKKQAQEPIEREATRAGMPYVNYRWLGGMLTNWATIKTRISRLEELEQMRDNGGYDALPKKEVLKLEAERAKLERNLSGIRSMDGLPEAVFIVDTRREVIPVAEARKLNIPIIGMVDTNCDPDEVDFVIPSNDDAMRSIALICRIIADAVVEGRSAAGLPVGADSEPVMVSGTPGQIVVEEDRPAATIVVEAGETEDAATPEEEATEAADSTPDAGEEDEADDGADSDEGASDDAGDDPEA